VSPVKYELGSYIPEDDILHSHCRESPKSYNPSRCLAWNSFVTTMLLFTKYSYDLISCTDRRAAACRLSYC
jgi:hypothetical protein